MRYVVAISLFVGILGFAAAEQDSAGGAALRGKKLFHDTQELAYPSCADCHNVIPEKHEAEKAEHLPPGGTLWGAAVREGWRNMNTFADVGEALQYCAKTWQKRKGGFQAAQTADLVAYLKTIGPEEGTLPKRKVQKRPRLLDDLGGGDAAKGKALAQRYCGGCHNEEETALSFAFKPNRKAADLVARKVRGYDARRRFKPQEGSMSYYTTDRLEDEDLKHILAYVGR